MQMKQLKKDSFPLSSTQKIIWIFFILGMILALFILYFTLSKAEIIIYPKTEKKEVGLSVTIDIKAEASDLSANILPGRVIIKEKEGRKMVTKVSAKEIPQKARGKVIIYNRRSEDQPLLKNSHLKSDNNVYFLTDERVVVPAKGEIEVPVTAEKEGKEGNLPPTHFVIDRLWQGWWKDIYAESKEPMTGGVEVKKIVLEEDIKKAHDELTQELFREILEEIKTETDQIIKEEAVKKEFLDLTSSIEPGSEADRFEVFARVKVTALIFDDKNLFALLSLKLKENIPQELEFSYDDPETFRYQLKNFQPEQGRGEIKAALSGFLARKISSKALEKDPLIGRNMRELEEYFRQFPEIDRIETHFSPPWIKSVPPFKDKIEIKIGKT